MLLKEKTCESCGISFITESTAKRHCTYKCCRDKHKRKRKKIYKLTNCASCYNLMIPKNGRHKYCTPKCPDAFRRTQAKEQRIQDYMKQGRTCTWCQISKIPINADYRQRYCTLKCKKQAERYRAKQRKRNQQHNTPIKEETEETPFTQASRIW